MAILPGMCGTMSAKESQKSTSLGTAAWLDGIDGENLPRLITSDKSVIRVVAGPGSGKTLGLQRRVQRLIQADSVDPSKIFVGTFTRAITAELAVSLGDQLAKGIEVSTLHSLAYRLLRDNPHVFQGRALRFLLNFETSPMLYDVGHTLSDSSTQADRGRLLRRLQADYAHKREAGEAMFAGEVDRWLRRHGGMLIDEIVPFATRAMENHDIKQGMFDHVLIDEYQDLTASEQALVELVWSRKGSLVIFGDDDQRIYGFRFSNPGGITEFADRWDKDDFEDITIPDNHRSGSDIVGAANTMMAEAGPSKEEMVPKFPESGSVLRVIWSNLEDEIAGLATYIKSRPEQDFLVLVPLRVIGYRLQEAVGEDAQTSFSEGLLEHYVVQERFTLASVIANPDDRIARRTWFGFRGDGANPAPQRNNVAYLSAIESELPGIDLIQAIADSWVSIKGNGENHVIARAKRLLEYQASMPVDLNEKIEYLFDSACAGEVDDEEKREWAVKDLDAIRKGALGLLEDDEISDLAGVMNKLR